MKRMLLSLLAVSFMTIGAGVVQAANPMADKEVKPTIMERLLNDAIKGTLLKTDGEFYWIKDDDGVETQIHVDKSTKMDNVGIGDEVIAYVNNDGHATTVQRD